MNKYVERLQVISERIAPRQWHWDGLPSAYVPHAKLTEVLEDVNNVIDWYIANWQIEQVEDETIEELKEIRNAFVDQEFKHVKGAYEELMMG